MSKLLALIVGALLLLVPTNVFASQLSDIASATYKLYENGNAVCSGQFVISTDKEDVFLTAAHCIESKTSVYSVRKQILNDLREVEYEEIIYLQFDKVLAELDVATLKVKRPELVSFNTVQVASIEEGNSLLVGDAVIAVGYPVGEDITITEGLYSAKRMTPLSKWKGLFNRATAPIAGGSSGGGFYAMFDGQLKLVGTSSASRTEVSFVAIFSLIESVHKVLA